MKIKKRLCTKMYIILSIVFILLTLLLYSLQRTQYKPESKPVTVQIQTPVPYARYYSKFLKVNFEYPVKYTIQDTYNDITLTKGTHQLQIGRIATNYDTVEGYIDSLERLNHVRIIDRHKQRINGIQTIKGVIKHNKANSDTYIYFLYPTEWTIFTVSTNEEALIPELDLMVQSFQYVP